MRISKEFIYNNKWLYGIWGLLTVLQIFPLIFDMYTLDGFINLAIVNFLYLIFTWWLVYKSIKVPKILFLDKLFFVTVSLTLVMSVILTARSGILTLKTYNKEADTYFQQISTRDIDDYWQLENYDQYRISEKMLHKKEKLSRYYEYLEYYVDTSGEIYYVAPAGYTDMVNGMSLITWSFGKMTLITFVNVVVVMILIFPRRNMGII